MPSENSIYIDVGSHFLNLVHTFNSCIQKTLNKYGLYPGQPQILFAIKELAVPTQNDLAIKLKVSKASIGTSLRRLEKSGFVKRSRDKSDTRCIRISLTQKGLDYARWCEIDFEMIYMTMLESFNAEERDTLLKLIPEINKNLSGLKERLDS